MTAAKPTPGPWQMDYPDGWGGVFVESVDATKGKPLIASLYERESAFPPDDEERKANARLIAAAPDLLAALKALEWAVDGLEYAEEVAAARAAIAKATGGAA